ncbi:MAG: Mur ligase family protein, partial [Oscillospiraceae bacterium]
AGYKTGEYTSPFVVDFRERIQIDGEMISQQELTRLTERFLPYALQTAEDIGENINEFEFITALAFAYFLEQKCDIVVLEVGLGGQFDATNMIVNPLATVITPIGLDHTQLLGNTITEIATEKCGIIKKNGVTIVNPCQSDEALEVIFKRCCEMNNKLIMPNINNIEDASLTLNGTTFSYGGEQWKLSLPGEYQLSNAVTAIETAEHLCGFGVSIPAIKKGLSTAFIAARMEVLCQYPTILLDGAHNSHGATALVSALKKLNCTSVTAITGILEEKDWQKTITCILPLCKKIVTLTPPSPRALQGNELAEWITLQGVEAIYAHTPKEALGIALNGLHKDDTLLIFGSLYLAGEMRQVVLESNLNKR